MYINVLCYTPDVAAATAAAAGVTAWTKADATGASPASYFDTTDADALFVVIFFDNFIFLLFSVFRNNNQGWLLF
jgi:predicted small integral membrane protein